MVKNDDDDCKATNSIELGPVGNTRTSNRSWSVLCREKTHHWAIEASRIFWGFLPRPRRINWISVVRHGLNRCNIRAGHRDKTYDQHGFTLIESCYSICGCSSMVEPQPSKLAMPVRSRSPAPDCLSDRSNLVYQGSPHEVN